ncbi:hypothetical protein K431DRAFT_308505 [Polychaeton citri CBS 116435]|uniref:Uncharacterized protein n=1 Tax=Polychaeton citri CBS 116435 TaxID=1314669 RepID=A0A9P4URV3_9PEZI|nr:hypothetical protein K431DRAFT_308505 [Polychaeton citri CBS 116435]
MMLIKMVEMHGKADPKVPALRKLILDSVSLSIDLDGVARNQHQTNGNNLAIQMQPLPHSNQPTSNSLVLTPGIDFHNGSWPTVLNLICPGRRPADYIPNNKKKCVNTSLRTLELKSCGYVKLPPSSAGRQDEIGAHFYSRQPLHWFKRRKEELDPVMMQSNDLRLGEIIQGIRKAELKALKVIYNLEEGWRDSEAARNDARYDSLLPGGTGRVSGIMKMDPLTAADLDREEMYQKLHGQTPASSMQSYNLDGDGMEMK